MSFWILFFFFSPELVIGRGWNTAGECEPSEGTAISVIAAAGPFIGAFANPYTYSPPLSLSLSPSRDRKVDGVSFANNSLSLEFPP